MRIKMLAVGTRGDVQPYVALGLGLQQAGFDVTIVTTRDFEPFVQEWGLPYLTGTVDIRAFLTRSGQEGEDGKRRSRKAGRAQRMEIFTRLLNETLELAQDADLLIYSPATSFAAPHIAEKWHIPTVVTMLQPYVHPTSAFPAIAMPALPLGGWYNRLTYTFFERMLWMAMGPTVKRWRRESLGLESDSVPPPFEALRKARVPALYGVSPVVLPKPPEWDEHVHMTGYWFLPAREWQPPAALAGFLEAGPPPVYIGFGSMVSRIARRNPEETAGIVLGAIQRAGVRAVIASGWEGIDAADLPDNVLLIESAPHDWLFPRMAALVHHGGAGTTGEGLRSGAPSVIVPFGGDQPLWGRRVMALGVGPEPIPRRKLTADELAYAIRVAVEHASMRARAAEIGKRIHAEDGVGVAVRIIEQVVQRGSV